MRFDQSMKDTLNALGNFVPAMTINLKVPTDRIRNIFLILLQSFHEFPDPKGFTFSLGKVIQHGIHVPLGHSKNSLRG